MAFQSNPISIPSDSTDSFVFEAGGFSAEMPISKDNHPAHMNGNASQLQREYRHMELNRRAYADKSSQKLRKQTMIIEKLRKETCSLEAKFTEQLQIAQRPILSGTAEYIMKLRKQIDSYIAQIESEKISMHFTSEKIEALKVDISNQRRAMGGINAAKENEQMVLKQARILENRLNKVVLSFNEMLGQNKELRAKIDTLQREREIFSKIYTKMNRNLDDKKKAMASLIEQSNACFKIRDKNYTEVAAIHHKNNEEQEEFENCLKNLGTVYEKTLTLPVHEILKKHSGSVRRQHQKFNGNLHININETTDKCQEIFTENEQLQFSTEVYKDAIERIQSSTGLADINQLVDTFKNNDDSNFTMFQQVSAQYNEINALENEIQDISLRNNIDSVEYDDLEKNQKQKVESFQKEIIAIESAAKKWTENFQSSTENLNEIVHATQMVLSKILSIPNLIPEGPVNQQNLGSILAAVEDHATELLLEIENFDFNFDALSSKEKSSILEIFDHCYSYIQDDISSSNHQDLDISTREVVKHNSFSLSSKRDSCEIVPPSIDDYSSDDELKLLKKYEEKSKNSFPRVISQEELRASLQLAIKK